LTGDAHLGKPFNRSLSGSVFAGIVEKPYQRSHAQTMGVRA
jgi:hypothetical protein